MFCVTDCAQAELCTEMPFISGLESNFWRSSYSLIAISGDEKP